MSKVEMPAEIIWKQPSPWRKESLLADLSKRLKGRVEQAFLFGSHARGVATEDSDIDLVLVANSSQPRPERFRDFMDLIDQYVTIDLIIYSPREFEQLSKEPTSFFEHARSTWVQIV